MESILIFFGGIVTGILLFIGYGAKRALSDSEWDDSNITNFLRLLTHVFLHPGDFGKMYYVDKYNNKYRRPFWYISKDELSEVVDTRP